MPFMIANEQIHKVTAGHSALDVWMNLFPIQIRISQPILCPQTCGNMVALKQSV